MLPIIAGVIIAVPPVLIWIRINSLEYDINNNINALKCKLDNTIPK